MRGISTDSPHVHHLQFYGWDVGFIRNIIYHVLQGQNELPFRVFPVHHISKYGYYCSTRNL